MNIEYEFKILNDFWNPMKFSIFFLAAASSLAFCPERIFAHTSLLNLSKSLRAHACVSHFLPDADKRSFTFFKSIDLISHLQKNVIVETGTARCGNRNLAGDGGSSLIFSRWAGLYGGEFYSVDIDPKALSMAQSSSFASPRVHFICSDSVDFLSKFPSNIDLLYLDSYDYEIDNPGPSQEHHLKEIMAAYDKLHKGSVVLIDDCDLPGGGKGRLVIEFLLSKGWRIFHSGYQVILNQQ